MIRNGNEYRESIRDGREVHINGERVRDVTTHPSFKPLVDIRARIYDMAHDPKTRDLMTYEEGGERSPIGRTKTMPASGAEHLRLAVASCSNFPFGYFNAYGGIARRADLDAVLHLGDYQYEYKSAPAATDTVRDVRGPETVTLANYRQRLAQYHADPDLQAALDLDARESLGMHFGTFDLTDEPLDEPPARFLAAARERVT